MRAKKAMIIGGVLGALLVGVLADALGVHMHHHLTGPFVIGLAVSVLSAGTGVVLGGWTLWRRPESRTRWNVIVVTAGAALFALWAVWASLN